MARASTVPVAEDTATPEISPAVMALAHAIRRDIIVALARGTTSPTEIAAVLERPLGVVAYHVRMLVSYGVLEVERTEPRRGALQHFYRFTRNAYPDLCAARELFGAATARVLEAGF